MLNISQDHIALLCAYKGTVWGKTLAPCLINAFIYFLLKYGRTDLYTSYSFDGTKLFAQSLLVGLVLVIMTNLAYDRFRYADDIMLDFFHSARSVALKAAIFSGEDDGEQAILWRKLVRDRLVLFLQRAIDILEVWYCMD